MGHAPYLPDSQFLNCAPKDIPRTKAAYNAIPPNEHLIPIKQAFILDLFRLPAAGEEPNVPSYGSPISFDKLKETSRQFGNFQKECLEAGKKRKDHTCVLVHEENIITIKWLFTTFLKTPQDFNGTSPLYKQSYAYRMLIPIIAMTIRWNFSTGLRWEVGHTYNREGCPSKECKGNYCDRQSIYPESASNEVNVFIASTNIDHDKQMIEFDEESMKDLFKSYPQLAHPHFKLPIFRKKLYQEIKDVLLPGNYNFWDSANWGHPIGRRKKDVVGKALFPRICLAKFTVVEDSRHLTNIVRRFPEYSVRGEFTWMLGKYGGFDYEFKKSQISSKEIQYQGSVRGSSGPESAKILAEKTFVYRGFESRNFPGPAIKIKNQWKSLDVFLAAPSSSPAAEERPKRPFSSIFSDDEDIFSSSSTPSKKKVPNPKKPQAPSGDSDSEEDIPLKGASFRSSTTKVELSKWVGIFQNEMTTAVRTEAEKEFLFSDTLNRQSKSITSIEESHRFKQYPFVNGSALKNMEEVDTEYIAWEITHNILRGTPASIDSMDKQLIKQVKDGDVGDADDIHQLSNQWRTDSDVFEWAEGKKKSFGFPVLLKKFSVTDDEGETTEYLALINQLPLVVKAVDYYSVRDLAEKLVTTNRAALEVKRRDLLMGQPKTTLSKGVSLKDIPGIPEALLKLRACVADVDDDIWAEAFTNKKKELLALLKIPRETPRMKEVRKLLEEVENKMMRDYVDDMDGLEHSPQTVVPNIELLGAGDWSSEHSFRSLSEVQSDIKELLVAREDIQELTSFLSQVVYHNILAIEPAITQAHPDKYYKYLCHHLITAANSELTGNDVEPLSQLELAGKKVIPKGPLLKGRPCDSPPTPDDDYVSSIFKNSGRLGTSQFIPQGDGGSDTPNETSWFDHHRDEHTRVAGEGIERTAPVEQAQPNPINYLKYVDVIDLGWGTGLAEESIRTPGFLRFLRNEALYLLPLDTGFLLDLARRTVGCPERFASAVPYAEIQNAVEFCGLVRMMSIEVGRDGWADLNAACSHVTNKVIEGLKATFKLSYPATCAISLLAAFNLLDQERDLKDEFADYNDRVRHTIRKYIASLSVHLGALHPVRGACRAELVLDGRIISSTPATDIPFDRIDGHLPIAYYTQEFIRSPGPYPASMQLSHFEQGLIKTMTIVGIARMSSTYNGTGDDRAAALSLIHKNMRHCKPRRLPAAWVQPVALFTFNRYLVALSEQSLLPANVDIAKETQLAMSAIEKDKMYRQWIYLARDDDANVNPYPKKYDLEEISESSESSESDIESVASAKNRRNRRREIRKRTAVRYINVLRTAKGTPTSPQTTDEVSFQIQIDGTLS